MVQKRLTDEKNLPSPWGEGVNEVDEWGGKIKEKRIIKRVVNGKSVQKRNTSSEWLHHPPSPQGEGKQETRLREASNTMRGWQANKKRIYAPPAILGLCPKLKSPPFSREDNFFSESLGGFEGRVARYARR